MRRTLGEHPHHFKDIHEAGRCMADDCECRQFHEIDFEDSEMELDTWTVLQVTSRSDDLLFEAIITAKGGMQLIAQCPSLTVAEHIVKLHNNAAELFISSEHPKNAA